MNPNTAESQPTTPHPRNPRFPSILHDFKPSHTKPIQPLSPFQFHFIEPPIHFPLHDTNSIKLDNNQIIKFIQILIQIEEQYGFQIKYVPIQNTKMDNNHQLQHITKIVINLLIFLKNPQHFKNQQTKQFPETIPHNHIYIAHQTIPIPLPKTTNVDSTMFSPQQKPDILTIQQQTNNRLHPYHIHQNWKPINKMNQLMNLPPSIQSTKPAHHNQNANATFINQQFATVESTIKTLQIKTIPFLKLKTIVTHKQNNRVFIQSTTLQRFQDPTNTNIDTLIHSIDTTDTFRETPNFTKKIRVFIRQLNKKIQHVVHHIQKERLTSIPLNELNNVVNKHINNILPIQNQYQIIKFETILPIITPTPTKTNKLIEPTNIKIIPQIQRTQIPFPNQTNNIANQLKNLHQDHLVQTQPLDPPHVENIDHTNTIRIPTNEQNNTQQGTNKQTNIMLHQRNTFIE